MKFQDSVFVVTGAGGGLGGELALQLIKRGAKVAAVDLREEGLETIKAKIETPDCLSLHALNITDREAVTSLPETVIQAHGQIDGLINCAGIIQPFVTVNDLDFDAIERVMGVNFYGTLNMTKAFLPRLLKNSGEAYIANVSSMGGFLPVPGQSVYGASKAAVKLLTEGLYAELLHTNVRVSTIFPGATQTDITKNSGVEAPKSASADAQSNFPMLSAEEAARLILKGIEQNKPYIYTGKDSKLMNKLYRLAPAFATKLIAKQMRSLLER